MTAARGSRHARCAICRPGRAKAHRTGLEVGLQPDANHGTRRVPDMADRPECARYAFQQGFVKMT
jgi:hypothetical protein